MNPLIRRPDGLVQVIDVFGNPRQYIGSDGTISPNWVHATMTYVTFPKALPLSWDESIKVTRTMCHRLIAPFLGIALEEIAMKYPKALKTFGGCYNYRSTRSSSKLSLHTWGVALDFNTATNPMQKKLVTDFTPEVVSIFEEWGFYWGGNFSGMKDPMHFQFATGY